MPENNERNKEKTFLRQENVCACAGANTEYQLPLFKSDTSSAEGISLGAMVKATSNDVGKDVSNSELLVNSSNTQQTAKNENNITRDWSDLDKKDPCFGQKISNVQITEEEDPDLDIVCVRKTTLNGGEERWKNINGKDFEEGPNAENFSGTDVDNETYFKRGSPKQNVFLEFENQKMVITEQQVTQNEIEILKLTNSALNLDNEVNTEEEENASCCINKQALLELTKSGISNTEKYGMNSASDAACTRKDSFLKARTTSINTQRTVDDNCEINPTLFDVPLMFPRQPNAGISLQKEPPGEKENENEHCLADVTSYSTETGKTSLNDKWKRKPSDRSMAATSNQQFHIVAKTHPDGGWGWVVCLGAFLAQFIVLGMQNTAGIVYTELVKELKSPRGATAWVGSLATGIMFFLGPLTTSLCERCGCRIVSICGVLICIAGLLLSSIVTTLFPFYFTYGLMFGTGTSLCYFPTIIVLSKYFKRRIAVVNGLVTAGSGVGTLVMGPSVQALFLRFGVADTFRIVAGIFILVLLCGATFRPVPTKYSQHHDSPKGRGARRIFEWSIFKNRGYVIWVISLATFQLGYFVPFVHLVRHAEDLGVSPTDASFLIGYLSVASTAGRLFFGKMADLSCVNRIRMYQMGVFMIGICSFLVPLATGYVGLTAYAVTFGFFEACYVLLIPLVTNDIVGPNKMSYALGSAFTVMAFPMFLGPPIAGWMYDLFGDYAGAFYACGGISLIAAFLMFFVPRVSTKRKEDSDLKLRKLLKRRQDSKSHWEFLRILFGCLWKKYLPESKTLSNVQYSVIITTEGKENV